MKQIIKKIFSPNKILGFIIFNFSFLLLIYVFVNHLEDTFLAYLSYLLSTYSLILFIFWFYHACKFSTNFIKSSHAYQFYQKHFNTILKSSLFLSTVFSIGYCVFNLAVGVIYHSFWFITFAVYYFLLSFMRLSLLYNVKDLGKNLRREYLKLKRCGIALLLFNLVLIGLIILILHDEGTIQYSGLVIYVVALYDFYYIISAFINVFKYRDHKSPIILASRAIKVAVAMISIISLEVAMITRFGDNDPVFKSMMTSWVGFFACLINSIVAIYMIVKANKYLKD